MLFDLDFLYFYSFMFPTAAFTSLLSLYDNHIVLTPVFPIDILFSRTPLSYTQDGSCRPFEWISTSTLPWVSVHKLIRIFLLSFLNCDLDF